MNADPNPAKALFLEAVERHTTDQWPAFLDRACAGRPALRGQVEALLAAHGEVGTAQHRELAEGANPGLGATIDLPPVTEAPGMVVGPYKLVEPIGEGGMGSVWMAQQTEPVKRLVAVKLIKAGMDSKQVIARFEAERQALALMDHPNIARVLDGGTTPDGRPYFVMDLVKGVPITTYCDEHRLTPRQRLDLFIPICQAVQHAHQKGIIHRDLKPSNVLVALYDGRPVPKVIDFGVAKAAGQSLTDKTLVTGFGAIVGTLEYMSPEQAEVNQLDIDTRSDIYSLGVLLYELLAGSPPFSRKELEKAGLLEMLRVIREKEPSRPSTKLSTAEGLPTLAANRGTEPAKLTRLVRGELDWIVMKALEKDRNRRYETANGFAADVQRYLADEPVLACPPSAGYRVRKFVRRNKRGLAVAALVLFFLVLLGSGVGWAVRDRAARRAEEARQQGERQAKVAVQVEPLLAEVDRLMKELKWDEALTVARRAGAAVAGGEADPATAERVQQVLRDLEMIAGLDELRLSEAYTAGAGGMATAHHPRLYAAAFRNFGVDVETLPGEESAARLRARPAVAVALAAALDDWARAGRRRDPNQSKRLWSLAAAVDPDPWRVSVRQASAATDVEALVKLADAPDTARQPPQSQYLLAFSLELCDRPEQALALLERACEIHPGDFWIHFQLAWLNWKLRPARLDAALRHAVAARALRPRSPASWSQLGIVLLKQKKLDEAVAALRKATELDPKNATAYSLLGWVLREQEKLDEAVAACRRAIEIDPQLAHAQHNLGHALYGQRKLDEAIDAYKKAIELDPKNAVTYSNLGAALGEQKKFDDAIGCCRKAIEFDPDSPGAYQNLGQALYSQNKWGEAGAAWRQAVSKDHDHDRVNAGVLPLLIDAFQRAGKPDEAVETVREWVRARPANAIGHYFLGNALRAQRKLDEAIDCYRTAIKLSPKDGAFYYQLGHTLRAQQKWDEAIDAYRKFIELRPQAADGWGGVGAVFADQKKWGEATDAYRKAIELQPKNANLYFNLGHALREQKKPDDAAAAYRKVNELEPKNSSAYFWLGKTLESQGKLEETIACFRRSVELNPNSAGAHYISLAWLLTNCRVAKLRDTQGGLDVARKAVQLAPQSGEAWQVLGWAHYRAGDFKASIEALEKSCALQVSPKGGDAGQWFFLAMAHWTLGEKDKAREWYDRAAEWMDKHAPKDGDLRRFRAEAVELLGLNEKK